MGLHDGDPALSAARRLSPRARAGLGALALVVLALWLRSPAPINLLGSIAFSMVFAANVFLRLAATLTPIERVAAPVLEDSEAPLYSIVAPLYREAAMLPQLVEALDALDYPKAKLDIKIVIEERDRETLRAVAEMRLPGRYEVIVAPDGEPRTKPRAMNVALPFLRGDYVVVFDAEDQPDRDQLRRAAALFARSPKIACLQARLVIDNLGDSWLTRLFAIEYAMLFDIVNPGLAAMEAPIALGGTSNHFRMSALRASGGWDAWNVTEDADLGLRLARMGLRVATFESDTLEEAPARLTPWLAQRRRWIKGWMQTGLVHGRAPLRLARELGWSRAIAAQALVSGTVLGALFGPMFFALTLWRIGVSAPPDNPASAIGEVLALALFIAGIVSVAVPAWLALSRRRLLRLLLWAPLLGVYYILISLASWLALYDLIRSPFHWIKTEHGLAKTSMNGRRTPLAPPNAR